MLENLKNGKLQTAKYRGLEMKMSPPQVVVFTNDLPLSGALTYDRLEVLTVKDFEGIPRLVSC